MNKIIEYIFSMDFAPHIHCFANDNFNVWLNVIGNLGIGLAYMIIPCRILQFLSRQAPQIIFKRGRVLTLFAMFIFSCGITHFLDIVTLWYPIYRFQTYWIVWTALISLFTAGYLYAVNKIKITSYKLLNRGEEITEIQFAPTKLKNCHPPEQIRD